MAQEKGYGEVLGMGIWDGPGNITKEESHLHGIFNLGSIFAISLMDQWSL
jgi:hypothetical protein